MVWKKILFEVLKTAAMVAHHLQAVGLQSPVECPTNLATAIYKYADGFSSFEQFRNVTLPHSVFHTDTQLNLSILIGIIPHDTTLKHYLWRNNI